MPTNYKAEPRSRIYHLDSGLYEFDSASEALTAAITFEAGVTAYLSYIVATRDGGNSYFVNVFRIHDNMFVGSIAPMTDA